MRVWTPIPMYLSVVGVRPLSEERPWWGGGLLPRATQSRPTALHTGTQYHQPQTGGAVLCCSAVVPVENTSSPACRDCVHYSLTHTTDICREGIGGGGQTGTVSTLFLVLHTQSLSTPKPVSAV